MSKENKTLFDIIGITQYDFYKKTFTSLNEGLTDIEGTIEIPQQNGEKKLLQYNLSSSFNVEGANTGIVATLNDITPQIKAEQGLLELVKKQQELNELKTAFVNMVSHELRTPLTVISSSAEILELLLDSGKTKDELTVYTKQIIDEVEKMTAFMQDLLMVSKIEAGKMELHLAETNIHQLLQEIAMEGFHPWKDGRSLTMSQRRPAKNNIVDATMIKHAVQNLLHNAFKYSTGKAAPTARISYGKRACTISIIDNGIGIIAEDISKLFTSFMRGKNTGNIPGTGIGLVVVKYFIEQHKGMVSVKSKAGAGSIFSIYLPYTNS